MNRLRWQPYPDAHGFISYPLGMDRKHAYACIWPEGGKHAGQWRWLVRVGYPDAQRDSLSDAPRRGGLAATKQGAADAATAAWPEVLADAEAKGLL